MTLSGFAHRLVALRAMGPAPSGLLVELLLLALNTVPAKKVRPIVRAHGLDDMRGLAITTFATMNSVHQIWHESPQILPQVG